MPETKTAATPFRYAVQLVVRPATISADMPANRIRHHPPGRSGHGLAVGRQHTRNADRDWDGDLDVAFAPMSVTLTLADEVDVSRGDLLATGPVQVGRRFEAQVVWMDERPLDPGRVYLLKHAARIVTAEVDTALGLNEIGLVTVTASRPLVFDAYEGNRATGSFLLIDPRRTQQPVPV